MPQKAKGTHQATPGKRQTNVCGANMEEEIGRMVDFHERNRYRTLQIDIFDACSVHCFEMISTFEVNVMNMSNNDDQDLEVATPPVGPPLHTIQTQGTVWSS